MKKIVKEFSEFLQQGNFIEIAVGLLIASSFNSVVNSFSDNFIMPIINRLLGVAKDMDASVVVFDIKFDYGAFLSSIISFLIVALVLFFIVKAYNRVKAMSKKEEQTAIIENELSVLRDIKELLEKQQENK